MLKKIAPEHLIPKISEIDSLTLNQNINKFAYLFDKNNYSLPGSCSPDNITACAYNIN